LKLQDNVWFNVIWHKRSVATLIFCMRLEESDFTVTPSHVWITLLT